MKNKTNNYSLFKLASILMALLIISPVFLKADTISSELGPAGPAFYSFFIVSPPNGNTLNDGSAGNPSTINGNVGISGTNSLVLNPSSVINGNVSVGTGATFTNHGIVNGAISTGQNLTPAASAATSAYSFFNGLTATQSFGSIGGNTTVNNTVSPGLLNVIDISGAISLGSGKVLTINGPAGSEFVFNVGGSISLSGADVALTGGVTANDVVFSTPGQFHLSDSAILNGILININGAPTSLVSDSTINGELIANSSSFTFTNSIINLVAPEPGTYAILGGFLTLVVTLKLKRQACFR